MIIPLEDTFADVLGKAARGLGLSPAAVEERANITAQEWTSALAGEASPAILKAVAPVLNLDPEALTGHATYQPAPISLKGLHSFNTPWNDMTVNAYLLHDPATREAVLFDTSTDASDLLATLEREGLTLKLILLTHTHGDHVLEIDRIKEKTGATAWVCEREPLDGANPFAAGRRFECGSLEITTHQTSGHSPGGITYQVRGLERPVAIVGDALFAGSMGGAPTAWQEALRGGREVILTQSPETILCPGHGPLTTVAEERRHNPFFAATFNASIS